MIVANNLTVITAPAWTNAAMRELRDMLPSGSENYWSPDAPRKTPYHMVSRDTLALLRHEEKRTGRKLFVVPRLQSPVNFYKFGFGPATEARP